MKMNELHNQPVKPDTYEASMARNQLLRIGQHAIKLHNLIKDESEMEGWVAKKIDLAGDYVKSVYNYTQGDKAGFYEDTLMGMKDPVITISDQNGKHLDTLNMSVAAKKYNFDPKVIRPQFKHQDKVKHGNLTLMAPIAGQPQSKGLGRLFADVNEDAGEKIANMAQNMTKDEFVSNADELGLTPQEAAEYYEKMQGGAHAGKFEDAGEGHMAKSTLYTTAKYSIALLEMIKPGDDLEAWVQSKLNKAADYLQGAYNYEEYQKLNPYREEIDQKIFSKHSQIVQKNIDEILAKETDLDDIDTKPGMMRILAKRVNEVEKKIAKENRTDIGEYADTKPKDMKHYNELMKTIQDLERNKQIMSDPKHREEVKRRKIQLMKDKPKVNENMPVGTGPAIGRAQSILTYGKGLADAVLSGDMDTAKAKAGVYNEWYPDTIKDLENIFKQESVQELDEGLKDWARNLAAAGVIVGAVAGLGSINNAIDNSVPAVKAMNSAYEMAIDKGHTELADQIKKDISAVKVRLDSGRDLNFVKAMQDKYSKFMPTEGLAYESKLAIMLNNSIK